MKNIIYIASDHAGFPLKEGILKSIDIDIVDLGTNSIQSVDYPDFSSKLVDCILANDNSKGILICGSGIGMTIAANRDPGQFQEPDLFDITRRPNRHLSFGLGVHICAGNALARVEAQIAFQRLFHRFPKLALTSSAVIAQRLRFREVSSLHISVT